MRLGVHCSVRGGLVMALQEAQRLGCDTVQIFTRSPRMWRAGKIKPEDAEAFRRARQEFKIDPVVVHTPYLPNLCTSDETLYAQSYRALLEDLENCRAIGADYLVIHPGAYSEGSSREEGLRRLTDAISRGLEQEDGTVTVLLENMAGGGRRMGMAFEELAAMREGMKQPDRVGICLDTAHTLAAGFPFSTANEVHETLDAFDKAIGLKNLKVIHANDSKAERGSHRDLHEHIGKGHVGKKAFEALLNDPRVKDCAVILETPKDTPEADPRNIALMRSLMALALIAVLPWFGCRAHAPVPQAQPPVQKPESLEQHLMGTWDLRGRDGKTRQMIFEPDGKLTFVGGLEFYNPAEWTLIDSRHELILTLLHAPNEKLDIFHTYIGDGVKAFNRNLKEVTYAFDKDTWSLNVAGWIYSKASQPVAPAPPEPVLQ